MPKSQTIHCYKADDGFKSIGEMETVKVIGYQSVRRFLKVLDFGCGEGMLAMSVNYYSEE
jgi:2-polyprenyl-3-methyl-5-hydroxy-6-metoxy-1,4-benzoquinol methylase